MSAAKRKLRWAAWLVCAGLAVFLATLFSVHPLYFIAYAVIGCPLVLLGMVFYIAALWEERKEAAAGRQGRSGEKRSTL